MAETVYSAESNRLKGVWRHRGFLSFLVALVCLFGCVISLYGHREGSVVALSEWERPAEMELARGSAVSWFVCRNASRTDALPERVRIEDAGGVSSWVSLVGPRPLDLPSHVAKRYGLEGRQMCASSDAVVELSAGDPDRSPPLAGEIMAGETQRVRIFGAPDALLIAAVSSKQATTLPTLLFWCFFISLFGSVIEFSRRGQVQYPNFSRIDGIVGFFLSVSVAAFLGHIGVRFLAVSEDLFPGFSEMLFLVATNFVAFLAVFVGILVFRTHFPILEPSPGEGKKAVRMRPIFPIGLGILLAIAAAVSVFFAPLPGLSTLEMASNLFSTRLIGACFAILAGLSEELLFRGLIQTSLEARPGARVPWLQNAVAILVTTMLFVSLHIPQSLHHLWVLIPIGGVSIVSGILKVWTQRMAPSCLLHMSYNASLLIPSILL